MYYMQVGGGGGGYCLLCSCWVTFTGGFGEGGLFTFE